MSEKKHNEKNEVEPVDPLSPATPHHSPPIEKINQPKPKIITNRAKCICISNLAVNVTRNDVQKLLGLGSTPFLRNNCHCNFPTDDKTGKSKGYAYITVHEEVAPEIMRLYGIEFFGQQLVVEETLEGTVSKENNQSKKEPGNETEDNLHETLMEELCKAYAGLKEQKKENETLGFKVKKLEEAYSCFQELGKAYDKSTVEIRLVKSQLHLQDERVKMLERANYKMEEQLRQQEFKTKKLQEQTKALAIDEIEAMKGELEPTKIAQCGPKKENPLTAL